jgi:hypothetical protein
MRYKKIYKTARKYLSSRRSPVYRGLKKAYKKNYPKAKKSLRQTYYTIRGPVTSYLQKAREAHPELITGGVLGYPRTRPGIKGPRKIKVKTKQKIIYKTISPVKRKHKHKKIRVQYVYEKPKHIKHKKIKRRKSSGGSRGDYFFGGLPRNVADLAYGR